LAAAARVSFRLAKTRFGALTRVTLYFRKAATFICSIPLPVAKTKFSMVSAKSPSQAGRGNERAVILSEAKDLAIYRCAIAIRLI
jgi:hypothetical protein